MEDEEKGKEYIPLLDEKEEHEQQKSNKKLMLASICLFLLCAISTCFILHFTNVKPPPPPPPSVDYLKQITTEFNFKYNEALGLSAFEVVFPLRSNDEFTILNEFIKRKQFLWVVKHINNQSYGSSVMMYQFYPPEQVMYPYIDEYWDVSKRLYEEEIDQVGDFVSAMFTQEIRKPRLAKMNNELMDEFKRLTKQSSFTITLYFGIGEQSIIEYFVQQTVPKVFKGWSWVLIYETENMKVYLFSHKNK